MKSALGMILLGFIIGRLISLKLLPLWLGVALGVTIVMAVNA